jgi:hypothetical protein
MQLLPTISITITVAACAAVMINATIRGSVKDPYELSQGAPLKLVDTNSKEGCAYTHAKLFPEMKLGEKFYIVILPLDTVDGKVGCMTENTLK